MTKIKTQPFDAAVYLETDDDVREFLNDAMETGIAADIAHALGTVARAKGMARIAETTGLSRENLYKSLGPDGNPELNTIIKVLNSLNFALAVVPASNTGL